MQSEEEDLVSRPEIVKPDEWKKQAILSRAWIFSAFNWIS